MERGTLPTTPVSTSLAWSSLSLSLSLPHTSRLARLKRSPRARKQLLFGVSGSLSAGEMIAFMGPSGSGKTSLLSLLAGRSPSNCTIEGDVKINGCAPTKAVLRRCGFVFQDDLLLPMLSVRETVEFSAKLRMAQTSGREARTAAVDATLKALGLWGCTSTLIGNEKRRGVSGGERKRVAVAVELVSEPSLLFLDEPTSGLDSSSALTLVRVLKQYAKQKGTLVVTSLHQPRYNIFSAFDKLLLLSRGRTVYNGPMAQAVPTVEKASGLSLPPHVNPPDWFLDLIMDDKEHKCEAWTERFAAIAQNTRDPTPREPIVLKEGGGEGNGEGFVWATSSWWQYWVLVERCAKQERGNVFSFVNSFQILAVAVIASIVWAGSTNVRDLQGVIFFMILNTAFNTQNTVIRIFPSERSLMLRERRCGSYRMLPYFLARSTADTLSVLTLPIIYTCVIYFSVGLRLEAGPFFSFLTLLLLSISTAQSFGLFLSLLIPDLALATCVSFVLTLLNMLFGGFYVGLDRIPTWVSWISYTSYLYWAFTGAVTTQFEGRSLPCEAAAFEGQYGGCPIQGINVMRELGADKFSAPASMGMLAAFTVLFRMMAYWCLRYNITIGV